MRMTLAVMRLMLAVMRMTLAVMRLCGTTSGGEPPSRWRGGDRALTCDLRTRLVQWCGTQLTARMLGRRFVGFYVYIFGRHMTVIWCHYCQRSFADLLLKE
jgi:hypothetical protein